jgi:hypothetical protein
VRKNIRWDNPDIQKVRHMLNRGKSTDFIHSYMGMPEEMIERIRARINTRGRLEHDAGEHIPANTGPPIAPNYKAIYREDQELFAALARQIEREAA